MKSCSLVFRAPRSGGASFVCLILIGVMIGLLPPVSAQTTQWIGPANGNWNVSTNWDNGIPTSSLDAGIENGTTARLDTAGGAANNLTLGGTSATQGTLEMAGPGTLDVDNTLTIGGLGVGQMTLGTSADVTSLSGILGSQTGSEGTATVSGAGTTWQNSGALVVGSNGIGNLNIASGGEVSMTSTSILSSIVLGSNATGRGEASVDGSNSRLTSGSQLIVGDAGTGILNITNGAQVTNTDGTIALASGSEGTVTVDGNGSAWTNSSSLQISAGQGTLNLLNQGTVNVNNGNGTVSLDSSSATLNIGNGHGAGILQAAAVEGSGATLNFNHNETAYGFSANIGQTINVQHLGSGLTRFTGSHSSSGDIIVDAGTFEITQGGSVNNARTMQIGSHSTADGTITVDGTGGGSLGVSTLNAGKTGSGQLNIQNGGSVSSSIASVGTDAGSMGNVTVDGPGSTWNIDGLKLGEHGHGVLNVRNGGSVSSLLGFVGTESGATGQVTVSGINSTWHSSGSLIVGESGSGTLTIENGGQTTGPASNLATAAIGLYSGSDGEVIVNGTGSNFTTGSPLVIGGAGSGELEVSGGATAVLNSARLADESGSLGIMEVTGTGSNANLSGALSVGYRGNGTVNVSDGGSVSSASGTLGDFDSNSFGMVTVSGQNASWLMTGDLAVGESGDGQLAILNGGIVTNDDGNIANQGLGTSSALVDGNGSTWTNSGDLTVGGTNSGTLIIRNGGAVSNVNATLASNAGAGVVQVTGGNWSNSGALAIGAPNGSGVGVVELTGGTIEFDSLSINTVSNLTWNFGTLRDTSDMTIDAALLAGIQGLNANSLGIGQTLDVDGTATLLTQLSLDGGTFEAGDIANPFLLNLQQGTFRLTQADFEVGDDGLFGASFTPGTGLTVEVSNSVTIDSGANLEMNDGAFSGGTITNSGVISGAGDVGGNVSNQVGGEVRASSALGSGGLRFTGATFSNSGRIEAIGTAFTRAEIEIDGATTNVASTGLISGEYATLRFDGGLTNNGALTLNAGTSSVFGDITNTGSIVVTGGASATFYDDITQNGVLRVSATGGTTSVAVFLGALTGSGGATGGGDIFIEGDLRPGNSPGAMTFENDLYFGDYATLEFELGGLNGGTDYDQLLNTMDITLNGELVVLLDAGFTPQLGDSFYLISANDITDAGVSYLLPTLGNGLSFQSSLMQTGGTESLQLEVVPEPSTCLLLAMGFTTLLLRRRRHAERMHHSR